MQRDDEFIPGDEFHASDAPVYRGPVGWAVNKRADRMARVVYEAPHENRAEVGARRGHGKDYAVWVFSEEGDKAERLLETPLELMIDATFEAGAAVGLHRHEHTEEIYYLISGSITMTTVSASGEEHTETLRAGDAHLVKIGQSHFGIAGPEGARCIVVAITSRRAP